MPNQDSAINTQGTNRTVRNTVPEKELRKEDKIRLDPTLPFVHKPSSALSSAVSTISTITLTENDKKEANKDFEDSDEVR